MHRRLRWGNVSKAAGAALAVALVVAWPRLAPPEPALPGTGSAPLDDQGGRPPVEGADGGERRRRTVRAGGERGAWRPVRAEAGRAARRRTIRAGGREGRDGEGSGRGEGEGRTAVPGVGGGEEGRTVAGGHGEGGANVPGGDDERADPAPVEFGFERP